MTKARLTKHQRETLERLNRLSRQTYLRHEGIGDIGKWILDRDCGGPQALAHLYRKGYVERDIQRGPRGGEKVLYRLSDLGFRTLGLPVPRREPVTVEEKQASGEIDTRLIAARDSGKPVLVYVGETVYFRGVPGQAFRNGSGRTVIPIGLRKVPLTSITKVEAA